MSLLDIFLEALRSLSANKARSVLTILGIVVGIGSVIGLVSIGQGSKQSIEDQIRSVGTNLATVTNMAQSGDGLTQDDVNALRSVPNVTDVQATRAGSFDLVYDGTSVSSQVIGVSPQYAEMRNIEIEAGSFVNDYQDAIAAHVAVISPGTVEKLWGENTSARDTLGTQMRIGGVVFTVIGITSSTGGGAVQSLTSDTTVYVPISAAANALTGKGPYTNIYVVGAGESVMEQVSAQAEAVLRARHGFTGSEDADFSIMNMSGLLSMAGSVTDTLTALLAAIAGISLVVGGIGIMNMMLTTVTERIREIGLRKAIGATPSNITLLFLVESVVLTSLGGLVGIVVGWGIAALVNATGLLSASLTLGPVLLAVAVCMLIGIVFGYWPARRAAKLDPIEALRYQ
ncbi:MAG: ABC transporter permease [Coriobacteriia bacterium]|nr:ABC transporter permease [Coriobacteriia bacterium]